MEDLTATGGVPGPGRIGRVAIGDLLKRAAQRFPDRIAVTDGARRVTFTEIERDANRFANYLVARGMKPGEKISTVCNNSVEFVKALFGIHRAGPRRHGRPAASAMGCDGDRQIAQGRTAPGIQRTFYQRGRVVVSSKLTTPRHSGARASANPESRDSGSGPSDHPGMTNCVWCVQRVVCYGHH